MLKLNLGLMRMVQTVAINIHQHNDKLYEDFAKTTDSSSCSQHHLTQQQPHQHLQPSPKPSFKISSKKTPLYQSTQSKPSQRVLNQKARQQKTISQTLKQQQHQQHLLLSRKKKLLTQLNEINSDLKHRHQHSRIKSIPKPQENTQKMTQIAEELVRRMNQQRKEQSIRRKKSIQQLNQSIVKSIEQFHQSMAEEERMKEVRRREIVERINNRKIDAIERGVHVNLSKSVLEHFISNATKSSQSQINQSQPTNEHQYQFNPHALRMSSQPSQLSSMHKQSNPELHCSNIHKQSNPELNCLNLPKIKTQHSKKSLNSCSKPYSRSPFLQKVLKQEERNKKIQYLKTLQRKRVNIKRREYAQKSRGRAKYYQDGEVFLT